MISNSSRRNFLKLSAKLAALGAAAPLGMNLTALRAASQLADPTDYKALVCIFLNGGNDHYNTIVPYDINRYEEYANVRGGEESPFVIKRNDLANTVITPESGWGSDYEFALNPNLTGIKALFDEGSITPVMKLGTLLAPTTKNDYMNNVGIPKNLFSHNDQFSMWQTLSGEGAASGWGGRIGDIVAEANLAHPYFSTMTIDSNQPFSAGLESTAYMVSSSGPRNMPTGRFGRAVIESVEANWRQASGHKFHQHLSSMTGTALDGNSILENELMADYSPTMPATNLGARLSMVARLISLRENLGMKRQVFFVQMNGFDSHKSLGTNHPALLAELDGAMFQFQRALEQMGLQNNVTTFTGSDFGRSLITNGAGSDHGWAGHQFVMGGALEPKNWVGAAPTMITGGDDDVGHGRSLPALGVQQLGGTLAKWMGVPDSDFPTVFPDSDEFDTLDLGLFQDS